MEAGEEAGSTERVTAVSLSKLIDAYLKDYEVREFRSENTARGRVAHLRRFFRDECLPHEITPQRIQNYQVARRKEGAAAATINRETSALSRMCRIGVELGWLTSVPTFPGRLRENPPRQGFFEHHEYVRVRKHLPAPYQDVLDFAYYSGWRKHEILDLTWSEIDREGGVIRLSPDRSKTQLGRVLPISKVLGEVLDRRQKKRRKGSSLVFRRDHVTVRAWRRAWPDAFKAAKLPKRLLHDCRRTAARNLIRAGVPERIAMTLTGHTTRAVFDRYNIVNERELLTAGELLVSYLSRR
jgi:integrase